jgi:outer membrane protein OmpA-like peptidoglycan-associated protein
MKRVLFIFIALLLCLAASGSTGLAQESSPVQSDSAQPNSSPQTSPPGQSSDVVPLENTPTYHVTVVSRSTKAVNYQHHSGATTVDFQGTDLMPQAKGHASVESRTGRIEIDADFDHLEEPKTFGPEFLTYVLWAITPEGRPTNLGEIVPRDGKSSIKVSTDLQAFGLIVTAEPYFAVTQPTNMVVLENIIKPNTKGWELPVDAKFDLLQRGGYTLNVHPEQLPATTADRRMPADLLEAMNAVAIARAAGAERYAPDALKKAEDFLSRAQDYYQHKQGSKPISTVARGAVQSAEDARLLSVRRREQEEQEARQRAEQERANQARLEAEQAKDRESQAKAEAEQQARDREQAEQARQQAEQERQRAEQAKAEAERAGQEAEAARVAALAQQQAAQAQAQQAQTQAQQAQAQAEQARLAAQQAEQEKEQTRARLLQQLNQVLQTRETARGLIVDMPDVLFDTGKYTLKPGARERLAKVAGILLAYPGLRVQIEGHTDNVGGGEYNQQLSEQRARAVQSFLVSQGVSPNTITSQGFGMTQPVASNSNAAGRQLNRRVDLVVSGEAIGTGTAPVQSTPGTAMPAGTNTGVPNQVPGQPAGPVNPQVQPNPPVQPNVPNTPPQ